MQIRFFLKRRSVIMYAGLPGIILITCVVALLYLITPSLSISDAKSRVLVCMKRDVSRKHFTALEQQGIGVPDYDTAIRWKEDISRINSLKILSCRIKRPIPDIFLGFDSPVDVVEVVFCDNGRELEPRYFWISWDGIDREASKMMWYFSM